MGRDGLIRVKSEAFGQLVAEADPCLGDLRLLNLPSWREEAATLRILDRPRLECRVYSNLGLRVPQREGSHV